MENEELTPACNYSESDNKAMNYNSYFESLNAAARVTYASMFVIDFTQKKMVFATEKLLFANYMTSEDQKKESMPPYWSWIVEEDLEVMTATRDAYLKLVEGFTLTQKLNHTAIIDYRISAKNRSYVIAQKFTPLELAADGSLRLGLFCITPSTRTACEYISIFGKDFRYIYNIENRQFLPCDESMDLNKTEKEILFLSSEGKSVNEIAEILSRSEETIKTHKKNIFKKLHVKSTSEAILLVANYAL